jgi:phosphatidylinositol 4-kinase B
MWTSDADSPTHSPKGPNRGHNRIVRIPPGECVVLNSAERAPYLLLIEILVGELDFVPLKRANKEILRRIIAKDHKIQQSRRSHTGQPLDPNSLPRANGKASFVDSHSHASLAHHSTLASPTTTEPVSFPMVPSPPQASFEPQEEEIDLVEQLYGTDLSVRTHPAELSDSIVLPPTPKNKALDIATWSAPSPRSTSPAYFMMYASEQATERLLSPLSSPVPSHPVSNDARHSHHRVLSLEDYSERMRTAAIMLAQLNVNLVREAVTTIAVPPQQPDPTWSGAALNWITGSRPRSVSDAAAQQVAAPTRMKLQHAEATAIRDKIMQEMMALEEERMEHMKETPENVVTVGIGERQVSAQTAEDEGIVRRELNKVDPSGQFSVMDVECIASLVFMRAHALLCAMIFLLVAAVFRESWVTKKARIRAASPYGHLAAWDVRTPLCVSL